MLLKLKKPLMLFGLLLLTSAVSGCASRAVSDICLIMEPHRFSEATINAMTDEEVEQELKYNEIYKAICIDR